tara:strand:- start:366 stop:941 length:576 start_codon:yes stop_codon:yes gene_type:complete
MGWRVGLLGAIFTTTGLLAGILLAGRLSGDISALLTDSVSNDTTATVISYAVIIVGAFIVSQIIKSTAKRMLNMFLLGWVDSVGGIFLGFLASMIICGALLITLTRLSTDVISSSSGDSLETMLINSQRSAVQKSIHDSLVQSSLVPTYIDIALMAPQNALDIIPEEFRFVMTSLEEDIQEYKLSQAAEQN